MQYRYGYIARKYNQSWCPYCSSIAALQYCAFVSLHKTTTIIHILWHWLTTVPLSLLLSVCLVYFRTLFVDILISHKRGPYRWPQAFVFQEIVPFNRMKDMHPVREWIHQFKHETIESKIKTFLKSHYWNWIQLKNGKT